MSQIPLHTVTGTDASGNPVYREVVSVVSMSGGSIGGGSGGGASLSDLILMDTSGTFFIARDDGSALTYITLSGAVYTPVGAVSPADKTLTNYAQETGGNLAAINSAFGTDGTTPPAIIGTGVRGWLRGVFEKLEAIRAAIVGGVAVTGTFWPTTQPVSGTVTVTGVATATGQTSIVTALGTPLQAGGNVAVTSSALPTGAATSALQTTGNTSLAAIATSLGSPLAVTGPATDAQMAARGYALDATLAAQSAKLPASLGAKTSALSMSVVLATDEVVPVIGVGQRPFSATVTITRPANVTAYTAGQLISSATTGLSALPTLALGVGNGQKVTINNLAVISSNGAAATKGQFSTFLFNSASPSGAGFNDASSFAPTAAALGAVGNDLVGIVPNSLSVGTAAYGYNLTNDTRQAITDSSGNLYAALVIQNAYTPASAETLTITISGTY